MNIINNYFDIQNSFLLKFFINIIDHYKTYQFIFMYILTNILKI